MPVTNRVQRARVGLAAALDAFSGIAAVTGRASDNIRDEEELNLETDPLPMLTYTDGATGPGITINDGAVGFTLTAIAVGDDADSVANELLTQAEAGLTYPRLLAVGLDAIPDPRSRPWQQQRGESVQDGDRLIVQRTLNLTLCVE